MEAKKISDELSAAGQVTPADLQQAAQDGYKSVLNLRSPTEDGFLPDEQDHAKAAGLDYANVPLFPSVADADSTTQALQQLANLPKPILIHCGAGLRAGAIGLIATAIENGWTLEQLTQSAKELNISLDQFHLNQFIQTTYRDETPSS